jgi:hypothetical protein
MFQELTVGKCDGEQSGKRWDMSHEDKKIAEFLYDGLQLC